MSETITVDGFIYEIGKRYQSGSCIGRLSRYNINTMKFWLRMPPGNEEQFVQIQEITDPGTITKAPVELVGGSYYCFTINDDNSICSGVYIESRDSFFNMGNKVCSATEATSVTRLIPENEVSK